VVPFSVLIVTDIDEDDTVPGEFRLRGNYPNPFNPATVIRYDLPRPAEVNIRIYDLSGRLVRVLLDDAGQEAGHLSARWDGRDDLGRAVGSGVYFYELVADGEALRKKMVLLK
jgi:hypothetical protein